MDSLGQRNLRRILIADDDPVVRHWLATILESDRFEVVLMNNGRDAFRTLMADADFSAAVFDVAMPYLQGPDLIRHMRTEKRLMRIPVLMITAETAVDTVTACFSAGATIVLPKPFTKQQLQQTLRMMLADDSIGKQRETANELPTTMPGSNSPRQSIVDRDQHEATVLNCDVDLSILNALDEPRDDGLVIELIDLYLENSARQVLEIKSAVEAKKPQLLKQTAHALKGSSLTIGACAVGRVCGQIELEQIGSSVLADLLTKLESTLASTSTAFQLVRRNRSVPVAA